MGLPFADTEELTGYFHLYSHLCNMRNIHRYYAGRNFLKMAQLWELTDLQC